MRSLRLLNYSQLFLLGLHLRGPEANPHYPVDQAGRGSRHRQRGSAISLFQVDSVSQRDSQCAPADPDRFIRRGSGCARCVGSSDRSELLCRGRRFRERNHCWRNGRPAGGSRPGWIVRDPGTVAA